MAEAEGIGARNEALAENSDAVLAEKIAGNMVAIVEAAAKQFDNMDNLTVLNGGEGLTQMVAGALLPAASQLIDGAQAVVKRRRTAA